jgi:hypothetical protein
MDPHAERLISQRLDELEPAEVTVTPAANPYGGGSTIPADTAPCRGGPHSGGSFSDLAPALTQYRGGAAVVTDVELQRRSGRFVSGGSVVPIGQASSLPTRPRVLQPRMRVRESHRGRAGHRRTTSTRAGPSSDSDSPGPGDAGPQRRAVVVDERYLVVRMAAA